MKMAIMLIGGLLILFGIADLLGSFAGIDLWGQYIGVQLPDIVWKYSSYIEMVIGYLLFKAGQSMGGEAQEA